jgi:hypothetical protein
MGRRKVTIRPEVAEEIARISFFIESKGLPETAIKFTQDVISFFRNLDFDFIKNFKRRLRF